MPRTKLSIFAAAAALVVVAFVVGMEVAGPCERDPGPAPESSFAEFKTDLARGRSLRTGTGAWALVGLKQDTRLTWGEGLGRVYLAVIRSPDRGTFDIPVRHDLMPALVAQFRRGAGLACDCASGCPVGPEGGCPCGCGYAPGYRPAAPPPREVREGH